MPRRDGTQQVYHVTIDNIAPGSGVMTLVAPDSDVIIQPKSAVISSHLGGNLEYELRDGADTFLHGHVPSNESQQIAWPDGLELTKGSGVFAEALANDGSITLYYCIINEGAGITKAAARNATYVASLASPKAIRTPNRFGDQVEG
jgi:hypothetical protein